MNIPYRPIRCFGHELRFYPGDGWNMDLLESAIDQGHLVDMGKYYRLSAEKNEVASFNVDRLWDLSNAVFTGDGRQATEPQGRWIISIYGCVNVFNHGDDPNFYKRRFHER